MGGCSFPVCHNHCLRKRTKIANFKRNEKEKEQNLIITSARCGPTRNTKICESMHHPSPILKATVLLSPPLLHTLWIRLRRQESRRDIRGRHLWKQQVQQRQLYTVLVGLTLTWVLCQKASSTWGKDTD